MLHLEEATAVPDAGYDDGVEHGFCSHCFKAGLRQGLCGTVMPANPNIIPSDAPATNPCFVCYSPDIICNTCGRGF